MSCVFISCKFICTIWRANHHVNDYYNIPREIFLIHDIHLHLGVSITWKVTKLLLNIN